MSCRLVLLTIVTLSAPAFAASAASKANALAKEGDKLYKEGKYKEAAETLKKAYDIDPNPTLIFNIARAYDQAGDLQTALDTYRQYIALTDTDPQLVKRANLAMDRLRALVAKSEADKQLQDAEAKRLKDEADAQRRKAEEETERARKQKEEFDRKEAERQRQQASRASGRTIAGIAIGVLALGGLGTGIAFGLMSNSAKSGFVGATTLADKKSFEAQTKLDAMIADISFAAALALGITFAIVFPWSSLGGGSQEVSVALGPTGVSLGGTF